MHPLTIVIETYDSNVGNTNFDSETALKSAHFMQDFSKSKLYSNENTAKETPKVPRPKNAFFLYRKEKHNEIKKRHHDSGMKLPFEKDVSKIIGQMWQNETPQVRKFFEHKAEMEALDHSHKNRGYKYQPRQKKNVPRRLRKTHSETKNNTTTQNIIKSNTQAVLVDNFDKTCMFPTSLPSQCLSQDDLQALLNGANFDSFDVNVLHDSSIVKESLRDVIPLGDDFFDFLSNSSNNDARVM